MIPPVETVPDVLASAAVAATTVLALAIFLVALVSYRRVRRPRFLLLAASFGLFFVKGLALTWGLFTLTDADAIFGPAQFFDVAILLLLYVAVVKR